MCGNFSFGIMQVAADLEYLVQALKRAADGWAGGHASPCAPGLVPAVRTPAASAPSVSSAADLLARVPRPAVVRLPAPAARMRVPQFVVEPTLLVSTPGNHGGSLLLAQYERRRAAQGGLREEHPAHAYEAPAAAAGAGRPHSLAGPSCGPPRSGPLRPVRSHHGIRGPPGHVPLRRVVRDSVASELPNEQRTQASGRPWQERAALCACPSGCAMQLYPGEGAVCDF